MYWIVSQCWQCTGSWNLSLWNTRTCSANSQDHRCWWPGDIRSQGISSHGVDPVLRNITASALVKLIMISRHSQNSISTLYKWLSPNLPILSKLRIIEKKYWSMLSWWHYSIPWRGSHYGTVWHLWITGMKWNHSGLVRWWLGRLSAKENYNVKLASILDNTGTLL